MSFRNIRHVLDEWDQGSVFEKMTPPERARHQAMRRIVQAYVDQSAGNSLKAMQELREHALREAIKEPEHDIACRWRTRAYAIGNCMDLLRNSI